MNRCLIATVAAAAGVLIVIGGVRAMADEDPAKSPPKDAVPPGFNEALARTLGADDFGMRSYVLVVLKSSDTPLPAGPERDAMFRGHFENMKRLSDEGTLVLAGPFDGVDGWRGLFILAVSNIDEARKVVATDPVVSKGEMVPEFHRYYGSAALMQVRTLHASIAKKTM